MIKADMKKSIVCISFYWLHFKYFSPIKVSSQNLLFSFNPLTTKVATDIREHQTGNKRAFAKKVLAKSLFCKALIFLPLWVSILWLAWNGWTKELFERISFRTFCEVFRAEKNRNKLGCVQKSVWSFLGTRRASVVRSTLANNSE